MFKSGKNLKQNFAMFQALILVIYTVLFLVGKLFVEAFDFWDYVLGALITSIIVGLLYRHDRNKFNQVRRVR